MSGNFTIHRSEMRLQTTALLVLLLTVLTSAAPLSVESQKPPSILTPSNSTTSGDSQTSSSTVPLPTTHKQTQESSLKLDDPDFPIIHSIIPSAASPDSELPTLHNKQKPANSDIPFGYKKRDAPDLPSSDDSGLSFTYSAKSFPYGLNQDTPPSSDVSIPTIHDKTQESSLKLNDPDFPFIHSIIPSTASPDSELPILHNKQKPSNSDLPWIFVYKRDVIKHRLPFTHSAQSSVFPYGLSQESGILPSSDVSLPTVHDKTQKSSYSDFPVGYGVPSLSDSEFPYIFSEQKPAESNLPSGFKKRDTQPDLPTPDSELSYIHDAKSQPADSALFLGF